MSFLWLALAAVFGYLSGGDQPLALGAWLSPVFLLRFSRCQPPWRGYALAVPVLALAVYLSGGDMMPIPLPFKVAVIVGGTAVGLLLFLADRLLKDRLPAWAATLVLPSGAVALEFLSSFGPWATWGSIAYTQLDHLALLQVTSVTGLWGVTFLVVSFAPVMNLAWERGCRWSEVRGPVAAFGLTFALVILFGAARLARAPAPATVRVAGITPKGKVSDPAFNLFYQMLGLLDAPEGNVGPDEFRRVGEPLAKQLFVATEREAQAGAKLVVWSELAAWVLAEDEAKLLDRATALARATGSSIAVSLAVVHLGSDRSLENKFVLVVPEKGAVWEYRKARPVPGIEEEVSRVGDGTFQALQTTAGRLTGAICYDLDFPALIRPAGRLGATLFVAPSSDFHPVKHIHPGMARLRAIENGFALVRPAAKSISLAVDPYGRVLAQVDYFRSRAAALVAEVPTAGTRTIYSSIGDGFAWLSLAAILSLLGCGIRRGRRPQGMHLPGAGVGIEGQTAVQKGSPLKEPAD